MNYNLLVEILTIEINTTGVSLSSASKIKMFKSRIKALDCDLSVSDVGEGYLKVYEAFNSLVCSVQVLKQDIIRVDK